MADVLNQSLRAIPRYVYFEKALYMNLVCLLIYTHYESLSGISTDENGERKSIPAKWNWASKSADLGKCRASLGKSKWPQSEDQAALVWEDPTCRGATKPMRHNYRSP